jgi:hypothetical protein
MNRKLILRFPVPEDRQHVRENEEINIKGLYAVKIELDEHPLFGDLNSSVVPIKFIKESWLLQKLRSFSRIGLLLIKRE